MPPEPEMSPVKVMSPPITTRLVSNNTWPAHEQLPMAVSSDPGHLAGNPLSFGRQPFGSDVHVPQRQRTTKQAGVASDVPERLAVAHIEDAAEDRNAAA